MARVPNGVVLLVVASLFETGFAVLLKLSRG